MCPTHLLRPILLKNPSTNPPPLFDSGEEFWLGEMWKRRWQRNWSSQRVSLCAIDWMNGQTRWGWRGKHSLHPPHFVYIFRLLARGLRNGCSETEPTNHYLVPIPGLSFDRTADTWGESEIKMALPSLPVTGYSGLLNPSPIPWQIGLRWGHERMVNEIFWRLSGRSLCLDR